MSAVTCFRDFVRDRLSAVAEEIFQVFEKTVLEYEEELRRQRRQLDTDSKSETHLHELLQQIVYKQDQEQDEGRAQCQNLNRSCLHQEDPEPARIKEEHQDLFTSHDEEPAVLKQETDISVLTAICEKDILMDHAPSLDKSNSHHDMTNDKPEGNIMIERSEARDANNEDYLLFNRVSSVSHCDIEHQFGEWEVPSTTHALKKSFKCEICGKTFQKRSDFSRHQRIHTGVKPFTCNMCGKGFNQSSMLIDHKRVHTGDKPYPCDLCGKKFNRRSSVMVHRRVHTGEKPFFCDICEEGFISSTMLKRHTRKHAGVKPFSCIACGKLFYQQSDLKKHAIVHTN